jgi:predicted nucleic acid-binding protein
VYTSRYVLAETTRLLVQRVSHEAASAALSAIRNGELFTILTVDEDRSEAACERFGQYDDQTITLVDHLSGVLAEAHDATHILTFDPDDFRTLGLTAVPDDTGGEYTGSKSSPQQGRHPLTVRPSRRLGTANRSSNSRHDYHSAVESRPISFAYQGL